MKSTGEVIGTDVNLEKALYKGLTAAGVKIKDYGRVLFTIDDKNKEAALNLAKGFSDVGFSIVATEGTGTYFEEHGVICFTSLDTANALLRVIESMSFRVQSL